MELWIRSQDKENLLNNPLRIYYDNNYEGVHKIKANTYDETICLGTYKTKERVLEVLNEIQEHIGFIEVEISAGRGGELDFQSDIVYQMPEK